MGSRVSIIPGLTVGSGATLGAGAVVIKEVPAGVTVVGNPARIL
jgi:acetyltransferase-like isoleucine patch superfamily enzyme